MKKTRSLAASTFLSLALTLGVPSIALANDPGGPQGSSVSSKSAPSSKSEPKDVPASDLAMLIFWILTCF